jgi:hypothetical protein
MRFVLKFLVCILPTVALLSGCGKGATTDTALPRNQAPKSKAQSEGGDKPQFNMAPKVRPSTKE